MNVYLLHKSRDFNLKDPSVWNEQDLTQDLELSTLFNAMANGDELLFKVAQKTILSQSNNNIETILYRQEILRDCLKNPEIVRLIYDIATGAIEKRKTSWFGVFSKYPSSILSSGIGMMEIFLDILKQLRTVADENATKFQSQGFTRFFAMLRSELPDEYFDEIGQHLHELHFPDGTLISYELGAGNNGIHSTLRKGHFEKQNWLQRLFVKRHDVYTFYIHPRDEAGARALSRITDEAINHVANALAQSNDHILDFFTVLQTEMAFYMGCLNLHGQLTEIQEPVCFPVPSQSENRKYSFKGLYDVCLALRMKKRIVGNDLNADNKELTMITGANQGGKSTFLRSIGLGQLMMQSGLFAPAEHFYAHIVNALFTHFKREEDSTMKSGKFDEELSRMNRITDHIMSNSMLLFNESFAATNEREGSEIAGQIVNALLEKNLKVFFVTHLYEFARNFYNSKNGNAVFLRAERETDTTRTFKLKSGEPLQTSYGVDVYNKIFAND